MNCIAGCLHEGEVVTELVEAQRVCELLLHAIEGLDGQARTLICISNQLPGLSTPLSGSEARLVSPDIDGMIGGAHNHHSGFAQLAGNRLSSRTDARAGGRSYWLLFILVV